MFVWNAKDEQSSVHFMVLVSGHWGFGPALTGSNRHFTGSFKVASGLGQKSNDSYSQKKGNDCKKHIDPKRTHTR